MKNWRFSTLKFWKTDWYDKEPIYTCHCLKHKELILLLLLFPSQKREAQVEEELVILRTAQAHVDRMAAEKVSLIQQKAMLQKVILVSLGLALAGPLTVLTMMTSGNVPQVSWFLGESSAFLRYYN